MIDHRLALVTMLNGLYGPQYLEDRAIWWRGGQIDEAEGEEGRQMIALALLHVALTHNIKAEHQAALKNEDRLSHCVTMNFG